jgi:hypothetical protein
MAVAREASPIEWDTVTRFDVPGQAVYTPSHTIYVRGKDGSPGYLRVVVGGGHFPSHQWVNPPSEFPTDGHKLHEDEVTAIALAVIPEDPPRYQRVKLETGFPRGEVYPTPGGYDQLAQIAGQAAVLAAQIVEQSAARILASE